MVGSTVPAVYSLQLRRLDAAVGTSGSATELASRPIIAAGIELPKADDLQAKNPEDADHPHTDAAWRLRHLPRSILKESTDSVIVAEHGPDDGSNSIFGRAMGSAGSV